MENIRGLRKDVKDEGEDTHSAQITEHVTYALVDVIDVGLPYILCPVIFYSVISYWLYKHGQHTTNMTSAPKLKLNSRLPGTNVRQRGWHIEDGCLSSCPNFLILLHVLTVFWVTSGKI